MRFILYELTMPGIGSWNGKWTGADTRHCVIRSYKTDDVPDKVLAKVNYEHDFEDGWVANIHCSEITELKAASIEAKGFGFCGYEWMVDNIEETGRIKTVKELGQEQALKLENIKKGG